MEAYEYLEKIRAAAPRVHCITNYVTAHDVANMILACGANPVMADEPQEMGEITAHAGAESRQCLRRERRQTRTGFR